jgi:hypothetical protein
MRDRKEYPLEDRRMNSGSGIRDHSSEAVRIVRGSTLRVARVKVRRDEVDGHAAGLANHVVHVLELHCRWPADAQVGMCSFHRVCGQIVKLHIRGEGLEARELVPNFKAPLTDNVHPISCHKVRAKLSHQSGPSAGIQKVRCHNVLVRAFISELAFRELSMRPTAVGQAPRDEAQLNDGLHPELDELIIHSVDVEEEDGTQPTGVLVDVFGHHAHVIIQGPMESHTGQAEFLDSQAQVRLPVGTRTKKGVA